MKPIRHTHFEGCCERPVNDPVHRAWSSVDEIIGEYDRAADYKRIDARIKAERAEWARRDVRRKRKELAAKLQAQCEGVMRELGRRVRIALGGRMPSGQSLFLHADGTAEWFPDRLPPLVERPEGGQSVSPFRIGARFLAPIRVETWVRKAPFRMPNGQEFCVYEKNP